MHFYHTLAALASFLLSYLLTIMLDENVEEQGDRNEELITKEIFQKIVGFQKIWSKFLFVVTANLYFEVLIETAHLSLLTESDGITIQGDTIKTSPIKILIKVTMLQQAKNYLL